MLNPPRERAAGTLLQVYDQTTLAGIDSGPNGLPVFADLLSASFQAPPEAVPTTSPNVLRMSGKVAVVAGSVITWAGCQGDPVIWTGTKRATVSSSTAPVTITGTVLLQFRCDPC